MAQRQWKSTDTDDWKYAFGDGSAGSSYSVPENEGCSGSSGSTSLTLASAGSFSNGDLVLIHQSRGSGAGNWELNKIASGGGTTSITLEHDLTNDYTDSGDNQAQIIELKQYEDLTTGSITAPSWNGSKGGIIAFLDKGTTTVSGTLNVSGINGTAGTSGNPSGGAGRGFRGGQGDAIGNDFDITSSKQGESKSGIGAHSSSANGMGGGAGDGAAATGGGGGHATSGATGTGSYSGSTNGSGGGTGGVAALTTMVFGGAGGGSGDNAGNSIGGGGGSGGIVVIISNEITITDSINLDGGDGAGTSWGSGAGSGGSCLLKCVSATLGSNKITASGGAGGDQGGNQGGNGGAGRIHLDYSDSYTGTTSPTLDATQDDTIVPLSGGGAFLYNLIGRYVPPNKPRPLFNKMLDKPENWA